MKVISIKNCYLAFFLIFFGCSQNLLTDLSSKSTDDALLENAQKALNIEDYQTAITYINRMSTVGKARPVAKEILASGYAGQCGLNFVDYISSLSTAGSVSMFKLLSIPFVGRAVDSSLCLTSLTTMDSIAASPLRTVNQNAFTAIVGMSLMGTAIRSTTDLLPVNGDGIADAANIACTLTDAQIDNVILGLGYMVENFSALTSTQVSSGSQTSLSNFVNKCTTLVPGGCAFTNQTTIPPLLRLTMRDLLNTTDYGVGNYPISGDDTRIPGACP
ncbi:MAG: hypothetical protein H7061_06190 [Bdellovibrionaceae bacterium]|nr:hypothetical protein [Bdellovibrio sp.]